MFLAVLALSACTGEAKPVTTGDDDDDDDNNTTTTDTGSTTAGNFFEPVAVGFEFDGGVLSDGTISGVRFPNDPTTTTAEYYPVMVLTFASEAFFSSGSDQDAESCIAVVLIDPGPTVASPPIPTTPFLTGDAPYISYDFALELDPANSDCFDGQASGQLDPAAWGPGGTVDLLESFNGAHFGMAFGPVTEYLTQDFDSTTTIDTEFMSAIFAEYIAINDLDGAWTGVDWTLGYLFEWNEVTHEALVDPTDDTLTYKPLNGTFPGGYVRSNAFWFQDFPLIDFSNLKNGAP